MKLDLSTFFDEPIGVTLPDEKALADSVRRRTLMRLDRHASRKASFRAWRVLLIAGAVMLLFGGGAVAVSVWHVRAAKASAEEDHVVRYTVSDLDGSDPETHEVPNWRQGGVLEVPAAPADPVSIPLVGFRTGYLPDMSASYMTETRSDLLEAIRYHSDKAESAEEILKKSGLTLEDAKSILTHIARQNKSKGFSVTVIPGSGDPSVFSIPDEVTDMREGTFLNMRAIYWTAVRTSYVIGEGDPDLVTTAVEPDKNDPFNSTRALVLVNEEYSCLIAVCGNAAFDYGELEKIAAGLELIPAACSPEKRSSGEMDGKTWRGVIGFGMG
ncbi:MAG: hypothetical protein IKX85_05815 [Clostridia bacterium]|nr:hypothetical protein [Clostridia bacterium]